MHLLGESCGCASGLRKAGHVTTSNKDKASNLRGDSLLLSSMASDLCVEWGCAVCGEPGCCPVKGGSSP